MGCRGTSQRVNATWTNRRPLVAGKCFLGTGLFISEEHGPWNMGDSGELKAFFGYADNR